MNCSKTEIIQAGISQEKFATVAQMELVQIQIFECREVGTTSHSVQDFALLSSGEDQEYQKFVYAKPCST